MISRLSGVTKAVAPRVRMQRTSAPASRSRRTNAAALTAAIPPVTPTRTFNAASSISEPGPSGLLGNGVGFRRRAVAPLDPVVEDLVHRHARRLAAHALDLRPGAAHHLLGALRGQQDETELAVDLLGNLGHSGNPFSCMRVAACSRASSRT